MAQRWDSYYWHLGIATWLAMGGAISTSGDCALAQITPDSTLGAESSVVTPTNIDGRTTEQIDGGATRGANLFHSFEKFSVPTGGAAYFNNAANIQNIFSRVTGTSVSNIDGLLRANSTANLFLLNPNGIIFGPNASLNIGGSFLASTASQLNFADGTNFSATPHSTTPLLTVSVPIGLQYGGNAGSILNQSQASNSDGYLVGLAVQPGKTLALVGGEVRLDGGSLNAQGGRVEIAGVAEPGAVGLFVDGNGLRLSFPDVVARANVYLDNRAAVNVRASSGGSIAINAQNLNLTRGSRLVAGIASRLGNGDTKAGDIEINSTGNVFFDGEGSGAYNQVESKAIGNAGNINVTAGSLFVTNGGELNTSTAGQGNAGNVNVNARDTVSFVGESPNNISSRVYSRVEQTGVGQGGDIYIKTGSLLVSDGAYLNVSTIGSADGGNVTIDAVSVTLSSRIFSPVEKEARFQTLIYNDVIDLPAEVVDITGLIGQICPGGGIVGRGESKFIVTGRGGLPPNPREPLRSDAVRVSLDKPILGKENRATAEAATNPTSAAPAPLVEAQGWVINNKGEVVLIAHAPNVTPNVPWMTPATCHS